MQSNDIISYIYDKKIKVQITNRSHFEDYAFIPRIELSPSDNFNEISFHYDNQ